jgi:hypothetical protein
MNPAALVPLALVAVGFVVFCLVDLSRAGEVRFLPKWAWAVICVVSVLWVPRTPSAQLRRPSGTRG